VIPLAAIVALLVAERRRPLRPSSQPALRRDARNLVLALLAGATVAFAERPVTNRVTALVVARRWGVLQRWRLPRTLEVGAAVVLMDYTLSVWHWLTHRVPLLWRFHQAHHVDRDLSVTTALRFHVGELLLSVPWRAAQIVLFGVGPRAFATWQTLTTVAISFHHANVRLPARLERALHHFVVTPRMHGVHHSVAPEETASNWSTIFTLFDRVHGTFRDAPQRENGLPAHREDLALGRVLALPFSGEASRLPRSSGGGARPD